MASPPPSHFDPAWYLAAYPDVAAAGRDPRRHYCRHGRREGRLPVFLPALWRERDLRWNMLEEGEAALVAMARGAPGPNRAYAAIACARAAARRGDWSAAQDWLRPLEVQRDLIGLTGTPDPVLLALEAAVVTGELPRARRLLAAARRAFGRLPDLMLAAANLAAAEAGHGPPWARAMARLYARAWLRGVAVAEGEAPAFDRLIPARPPRPTGLAGPLVSVVMPAFNAAATIGTALASLSGQSWQALEILVVDNGATDATAAVVRRHAAADPRIRLLDGSAAPGAYAARNIGVAAARGAFITVLDADDWAHPARIARQIRTLRRNPAAAATISDWVRVTPDLRFTRWWQDRGHIHPDLSSLMIRAELRARLGYWDRARAGADSEYHDRILAICGARAIVPTAPGLPLNFGRLHDRSLTQVAETRIDTQVFGARRSYMLNARRWHEGAEEDLPLPQHPARRPFDLPPALALRPPDPPAAAEAVPAAERAGLYDDAWYMRSYPDLRAQEADGLAHYLRTGAAEGRDPGPDFSTSGYALAQEIAPETALAHYLDHGRAAGADPLPDWQGALPAPAPGRHVLVFGHQAGAEIFGAERCLVTTLERAAEAGITPSVVLPRLLSHDYLKALLARCHRLHVRPYGWRFGGVAPDPRSQARLTRLIRDSGAVEVHQNTVVLDAPLRAARAAGVPSVVHVHELPASDLRLCADLGLAPEALRAELLAQADRFVANSPAVLRWLDLPPARALLMPNRVDPALADLPFAPATPPRIALIGSLTARKGIGDARAVARALARSGLAGEIRLIGPQSADLDRLGPLPANMRHMGYAPGPAAALAEADIVLSLSQVAESFGLSVFEALCAGRPVVCYDRGTPPDLVGRDGAAGHVVPADRPDLVARALAPWLKSPAALQAASRNARERGARLLADHAGTSAADLFRAAASGPDLPD
ncbi:glycosyltransferase [Marinovum sp.]|uniref:glycosyltransferase n=1 Tax=Marinovum sp. TaxID=2024839 RepID=UPI003A909262